MTASTPTPSAPSSPRSSLSEGARRLARDSPAELAFVTRLAPPPHGDDAADDQRHDHRLSDAYPPDEGQAEDAEGAHRESDDDARTPR